MTGKVYPSVMIANDQAKLYYRVGEDGGVQITICRADDTFLAGFPLTAHDVSQMYDDSLAAIRVAAPCDYCGDAEHGIENCPTYQADLSEAAQRDAATDKSDWPL